MPRALFEFSMTELDKLITFFLHPNYTLPLSLVPSPLDVGIDFSWFMKRSVSIPRDDKDILRLFSCY